MKMEKYPKYSVANFKKYSLENKKLRVKLKKLEEEYGKAFDAFMKKKVK